MPVRDSQGEPLKDGDSVLITKSLRVKGSEIKLHAGELIKNIRTLASDKEVEARIGSKVILLRTEFIKKA